MNFDDYEKRHFATYAAFSETVRFILKKALKAAAGVPAPQSIQCRAKEPARLYTRLVEVGKLDTETLEQDRRDLAGVRLIFYTNNDVDRFLNSQLIHDNFEVEQESAKVHYPTEENAEARYRAHHCTVRLRADRLSLPEYARFAGLRCEIQIQTILNHAWSETSHDILYKKTSTGGFGSNAIRGIANRFATIMDKYLIPAGYEIQKAQQEYERLQQGKELFDSDVAKLLDNSTNNNDRYHILSGVKDYAIPNYDDVAAALNGLKDPLLRVVKAARETPTQAIKTTFGDMQGFDADSVVKVVIEIIESLRYADPVGCLKLLAEIWRVEIDDGIRGQILKTVKHLAEYNLGAYEQVGPALQMALVEYLATLTPAEISAIRPIALAVWSEALEASITGTKWKAHSVVISTGAIPASEQLKIVRAKAIAGLFSAYAVASDDHERREVANALEVATHTPSQGRYSNDLLALTLADAKRIVDFLTTHADEAGYQLRQHVEHQLLYQYFRARDLSNDPENRFACQKPAGELVESILRFRDKINADSRFVKYKVLVGFESIYPGHWNSQEFEFKAAEEYRRAQANAYIAAINDGNEDEWLQFVEQCAATKSNDMATFPVFGQFAVNLAMTKPEIADRYLAKASEDLRRFLPGILSGLARSGRQDIYNRNLETELASGRNLPGLARHVRHSEMTLPELAVAILNKAIASDDAIAVIECFLLYIEQVGSGKIGDEGAFFRSCIEYLNSKHDWRWVREAWFLPSTTAFFAGITAEQTALLLENLGDVPKVDYRLERILIRVAERDLSVVWDFFGKRLMREEREKDKEDDYDAVPYSFHGLEAQLSRDSALAIEKGLSWYRTNSRLFQFRGGKLLSNAFPNCTPAFSRALADLVRAGDAAAANFALDVLQNYTGGLDTHPVLKEIVVKYPNDQSKISEVRISFDRTGLTSGAFGYAEALRAKKRSLQSWFADERPEVKAFAEMHIGELDMMIASEQRRAESDVEMRNRDFDDPQEDLDKGDGGDGQGVD